MKKLAFTFAALGLLSVGAFAQALATPVTRNNIKIKKALSSSLMHQTNRRKFDGRSLNNQSLESVVGKNCKYQGSELKKCHKPCLFYGNKC